MSAVPAGASQRPQVGGRRAPGPASTPLPGEFRLVLDQGARRLDGGRVLLGGAPLKLLRLSGAGARLLDRLLAGATVAEAAAAERAAAGLLARLLVDAGVAHPRPPAPRHPEPVAAVVPVRDRADGVGRTVAALAGLAEVVAVDDGSRDASAAAAARAGARVVGRALPGGPAAARNAGLAVTSAPLVAFVDSDCVPEPGWLGPLLAHLGDPTVGAVAPRIGGRRLARGRAFERYESVRAPEDRGPVEGLVRPRGRIGYVPTAALLVRREALAEVGGFDEALHFGEDVDLVWRLVEAGWTVRYEPASRVRHDHRRALGPLLARRLAYGTSAAPLARRHGRLLAPLQVSAWSALAWALAALGRPLAGGAVAVATTARAAQGLGRAREHPLEHPWRAAARVAGAGHWRAGRLIADAVVRTWLPLVAVAALRSRRARLLLLGCVGVAGLADWRERRPALDPLRYVGLRLLEDAAYCAGVWAGCARHRTLGPLLPDLSGLPWTRPPGPPGEAHP
jgi:mycofactocin glycosyltransferase